MPTQQQQRDKILKSTKPVLKAPFVKLMSSFLSGEDGVLDDECTLATLKEDLMAMFELDPYKSEKAELPKSLLDDLEPVLQKALDNQFDEDEFMRIIEQHCTIDY